MKTVLAVGSEVEVNLDLSWQVGFRFVVRSSKQSPSWYFRVVRRKWEISLIYVDIPRYDGGSKLGQ
jgi:hypothetical protein